MKKLYAASIIFGVAPLIFGIFVFALWYFTRADVLIMAGVFTIIGGLVSVLIAAICLIVYLWHQLRNGIAGKILLKRGVLTAIIIIANFPIGYFCSNAALNIITQYVLTIENKSTSVITGATIMAPGISKQFESIKPNEKIVLKLNFKGDGILEFEVKQGATDFGGVIEPYVTGSLGGATTLIFENDGQYKIVQDESVKTKGTFSRTLFYEAPIGVVTEISVVNSGSNGTYDIAISGYKNKHNKNIGQTNIVDFNTRQLKRVKEYRYPGRSSFTSNKHLSKKVHDKNPEILDVYEPIKTDWPSDDYYLANCRNNNFTGTGICVVNHQGNVFALHYLKKSIFVLQGTPVKFAEDREPYLAVLANYSLQSDKATLCIFSPEGNLVYEELLYETEGILAVKAKSSKTEILLVGNSDGQDKGLVYEYRLDID